MKKYPTTKDFAEALIANGVIDTAAWYDSDEWDGGNQRSGIEYMYVSLKNDFDQCFRDTRREVEWDDDDIPPLECSSAFDTFGRTDDECRAMRDLLKDIKLVDSSGKPISIILNYRPQASPQFVADFYHKRPDGHLDWLDSIVETTEVYLSDKSLTLTQFDVLGEPSVEVYNRDK